MSEREREREREVLWSGCGVEQLVAADWTVSRRAQTEFEALEVEGMAARSQTGAGGDVHRGPADGARLAQSAVVGRQLGKRANAARRAVVLLKLVEKVLQRLVDYQPRLAVGLQQHAGESTDIYSH